MWGEKKELRGGSIVEGEVASGVGRVNKGGYLLRFSVCMQETAASLVGVIEPASFVCLNTDKNSDIVPCVIRIRTILG
jgi:hypothetical protein